jgi:hypothetical protein
MALGLTKRQEKNNQAKIRGSGFLLLSEAFKFFTHKQLYQQALLLLIDVAGVISECGF